MKYCLPSVLLRSLLGVLLLAALGSCSVYHKVFHPYRLPTPKPSPEFKAQQKEAAARKKANEKASDAIFNKKKSAPTDEAATDVSTPSGGSITAPEAAPEASKLPEGPTVHYDKHGLMKKPKLNRRKRHKQSKPFRPWQSIRSFFKFGLHAKPNYDPDHRPVAPAPTAEPDAAPTPDAAPAEDTPKPDKKAPRQVVPKPDTSPRQEVVPKPDGAGKP
ncbi:hypothetical protein [Hymenobacter terricola]|uniref:hypothetical protein n=1 Tax=Hymenobacter terricola TaxID=2819236 RepID=UPI001B309D2C|nr:hypothetical protein [Hymenobacter terricola]